MVVEVELLNETSGKFTAYVLTRYTMLALGVAGCTAFQGFQMSKAFKGFGSSFDGACPSTPVPLGVACGMRITTVAAASCDDVLAEINARVNGQSGTWHDPHNNGTYTKCVPAPVAHGTEILPSHHRGHTIRGHTKP